MTSILKQKAKTALSGNWGIAIAVTLVYAIASGVASQFYGIGTIFIGLPLAVGVNVYFINVIRGAGEFEDIIEPFKTNYIENTFTMFLMQIYVMLWSLLLIIPGIIKSFSYAMVPYIMADSNYNLSYNDAITESRRLMDGRKMDFFILGLSFIGWLLLSILTFGILLIWLVPYMNATFAAFYMDIKGENNARFGEAPTPMGGKEVFTKPKEKQEDEWDF